MINLLRELPSIVNGSITSFPTAQAVLKGSAFSIPHQQQGYYFFFIIAYYQYTKWYLNVLLGGIFFLGGEKGEGNCGEGAGVCSFLLSKGEPLLGWGISQAIPSKIWPNYVDPMMLS